jgi:tetratricopeptide (TPR) repeat protein
MPRVDKTVFISYRRTNVPWALAIFQHLTHHGFDVFFDFVGITGGDFKQVILENIRSRAHFLVLLTPSALERCAERGDWFRREIEEAIASHRNIIPMMLESFDFGAPGIASQLTGELARLKRYSGLSVPSEYFEAAMAKLRERFLNAVLEVVSPPPSKTAQSAARDQQTAAASAPLVLDEELTAQDWFEKGYSAQIADERMRCFGEAVRLRPDFAEAYNNRAVARRDKGDLEGALKDCEEALRLKPDYAMAYNNRGALHRERGNLDSALRDYNEAIRLKPDEALVYKNRGNARRDKGDQVGALRDYDEAIRLRPDYAKAYNNRGVVRRDAGDFDGALKDFDEAIRLRPEYAKAHNNRGNARRDKGDLGGAERDFAEERRLRDALQPRSEPGPVE